jgi:dTDP-glucose 4,6-dehydratase/UDP-glucuronate decarboxylase
MKASGRVLVAGGAGFIGSNLLRRLLKRGFRVDCIDNLVTGQRLNTLPFETNAAFEFHPGDVADGEFMRQFEGIPYVAIYNLACPTGVPNIARLGEEMLIASSAGSYNLLRLAKTSGAKYLFASSAEAYGDPHQTPQREDYCGHVDSTGPRSAYEEGKRFGEALTVEFARKQRVDARTVRIFNTYGINMSLSETRVIPQMLRNMICNEPVVIYGDGTNTRAYQYVDDLLDGFDACMAVTGCGEVYNIGGDAEISVNELFRACRVVTGYSREPVFKPHFIEDHKRRLPDTNRIRTLGWSPRVSLSQGLAVARDDIAARLKLETAAPHSAASPMFLPSLQRLLNRQSQ